MTQTKNKIIGILFGIAFLFVVIVVFNTQQATATHCGIYDDYGTCVWYPYHEPEPAPYVPPPASSVGSYSFSIGDTQVTATGNWTVTSEVTSILKEEASSIITSTGSSGSVWRGACLNGTQFAFSSPSSTGGSSSSGGGGGGGGDGGGGGASAPSAPPQTYTHYNIGSWSACGGYDSLTGQGGAQTRSVSSYTNTTSPNDSAPSSSQSCNMPADFDLLLAPVGSDGGGNGGGEGGGVLGNTYSTFVTFIGNQQKKLSAPVTIAINPIFPNHPSLQNLTFSVVNALPSLPPSVEYFFNPNPLTPTTYSNGTKFTIDVPRTTSGLYTVTLEISGGGLVKQATVNLNVNIINPTFQEI